MSKGQQTRQRIISQAAPLFNERGYEGCSMQDIMAATGLEKGGIYRHFESKEELAAEAFDYAWEQTIALRLSGLERFPDPAANAVEQLRQHIANFASPSSLPGGCPLLNMAVDSDNGNAVLRERVREALHGWQAKLRAILSQGVASGTIRAGVDPERAANRIIGAVEGAILIGRIERSREPVRQAIEDLHAWIDAEVQARPSTTVKKSIASEANLNLFS
jgi:TetR/AcrR family transcriptional repressor of nem operon